MKYAILIALFLTGCGSVGPQERGVCLFAGKATSLLDPGPHFWLPVIFGFDTVDCSVQRTDVDTTAASKDMQDIHALIAVNWSMNPADVLDIYRTVGDDQQIQKRIIEPSVNEVLKASTAKKTAEEILSQRMELKDEIDTGLKNRLAAYGVEFRDVSIVHLNFSDDFNRAIEAKQVSEQQAKQAQFVAMKAAKDAEARVNQAKGEAEAQRLLQASVTPQILQMKAIEKWNGQFPEVMGSQALPFIMISLMVAGLGMSNSARSTATSE